MKHILLTFLLTAFMFGSSFAAGHFEFTPKLTDAYEKAISLQFVDARKLVEEVKQEDPNNVLVYYVENYIDFLKIFIDEDYEKFKRLEPNKESRLKKLKGGDESSPYYLYTQAEIRLQWAVARTKFNLYNKTAMFEVRKAYLLLEKNDKKFPDFVANKKSLGILHSVVGAVPPNFKWLVKLAGMSGTIEQGRREIKEVVDYAQRDPEFIFEDEAIIMYSLLILHLGNESAEAWNIIQSSSLDASKNPLICFAQASVAQHTGNGNQAIKILENRPKGSQYHPFHFLDYMLGLSKLYRQDQDAGFYLNKFVINFSGSYVKECYQRIAWFELLNGNEAGYTKNMNKVISRGKTTIEGDKNALKAAQSKEIPNAKLLKARLLFDGGFLTKAKEVLASLTDDSFTKKSDQLEFRYRKGRVLQELSYHDDAITEYNITIEKGRTSPEYFACRAALEAGHIKENLREYAAARIYFNKCLAIYPDQYQDSLHGKAKAGLNRVKGK